MTAQSGSTSLQSLPRPSSLALLHAGKEALRLPGMRKFLIKGLFINYTLFILIALLVYLVVYHFFVAPYVAQLDEWVSGEGVFWYLLSLLSSAIVWVTRLFLLMGTLMLALLFSLSLMSLWLECLVAHIVVHCRGGQPPEVFSLKAWIIAFVPALRDSLFITVLGIAALLLGFIPLLGPLLLVVIESYLLGWEIRDPYLVAREAAGDERKELRKGLTLWTAKTGLLPLLLGMIPVLGWLFLPLVMICLVAGFAWKGEQALLQEREAGS